MLHLIIYIIIFFNCVDLQTDQYQCTPCGSECDEVVYDKAGECPHCHMALVKKSSVMFKTIQPEEICGYLQSHPEVILLDVRSKGEYVGRTDNYGTLKNAINIPIQELEKRLSELNDFKDKEIIVYCSHSKRSPRASYFLMQHGFNNVTNMAGGMSVMKDSSCRK